VVRDLERAAESRSIKAIILRINSPGGSSMAADKIWHAVINARQKKPVVASISDLGASGGYYIALGADTIIAQPLSLVGSIGVYIGKFSLKNLYEKLDINNVVIKRGPNATLFSLSSKFSDSERALIRHMLNDFYQKFVTLAAQSRGVSYEEIDRVARGRVWNGYDGRSFNLIDLYGGMDESVAIARQLAHIDSAAGVRLIHFPRSRSLLDQLFNRYYLFESLTLNPVNRLETYLSEFQAKPLYLMPFILNN
jgi:protease-4